MEFELLLDVILKTKRNTKSFRRFRRGNNTKFNFKTEFDISSNVDQEETGDEEDIETALDSFYLHLQTEGIPKDEIQKLKDFIEIEEFDTDAVCIDIEKIGKDGNISNHTKATSSFALLHQFMYSSKRMSDLFPI